MAATEERKIKITLDGKDVNSSIKEMEGASKKMENQLKKMSADDPNRKKLLQDFQEMRNRIKASKDEMYGVQRASASAQSGLRGVTKGAGLMGAGFKSAMSALLPLLAITKGFAFLDDSKKKFESQANAVAQLDATLKSTGNSAGLTSKELQDMASKLQGKTLFGDEATIQAQSLLLTFTDIKKGVFEDALPAIQDMATKMAGDGPADLKGATLQVGKALNDPIKGITALSKAGVSFSEEQKNTIKTLTEMGDKAGAQKIILKEMERQFGGSAEAARKAGTGGWKAFMNTVGDVQELLGGKLAQGLNLAANFLGLVIEKSDPLVAVFKELWNIGVELYDEIYNIVTSFEMFNQEGDAAGGVVDFLVSVFTFLLYPIKVSVQLFSLLVTQFINLYNRSELLRGMIGGIGGAFMSLVTLLKDNVMKALGGFGELITGLLTFDIDKIKAGFKNGMAALADVVTGGGKAAYDGFTKGYTDNKNDQIIRKTKEDAEEVVATTLAVVDEGGKKKKELTEKQQKELEKKRAEQTKQELDAEKRLQDMRLLLIENETDRKIAALELQAKRETAAVVGTKEQRDEQIRLLEDKLQKDIADIRKAASDEAEKTQKESDAKELELLNRNAKAKADLEVLKAKKSNPEAYQKALLDQLETERVHQLANAELTANEKLLLEEQFEQKKFDIKEQFAEAARNMEMAKAQDVLQNMMQATNILFDFKKIANDKEMARLDGDQQARLEKLEKEYAAGRMSKEQYENSKSSIEANYGEKTRALKRKAAQDEKKANIANSIMAGALAVLKASQNPLGMLSPTAIMTAIFAGLQTAKIIATPIPAFATGGLTASFKNGGMVNNASIGLIGEAGAEWVMPNWMMRSPKYANTYKWLETERQGGPGRAFAEGGNTANVPQDVNAAPDASAQLANNILLLRSDLAAYHSRIEQWATDLSVNYSAGAAEEVMELRRKVKQKGEW